MNVEITEALYQVVSELRQLNCHLSQQTFNPADVPIQDLAHLVQAWLRRTYPQREVISVQAIMKRHSLFRGDIFLARRVLDYLADNGVLERLPSRRDAYQVVNLNKGGD